MNSQSLVVSDPDAHSDSDTEDNRVNDNNREQTPGLDAEPPLVPSGGQGSETKQVAPRAEQAAQTVSILPHQFSSSDRIC